MIMRRIDRLHLLFALPGSTFYLLSSFRLFQFMILSVLGLFLSHLHSQLFPRFHRTALPVVDLKRTGQTIGSILILSSTSSTALKISLKLVDWLAKTTLYYIQRRSSSRKNETSHMMVMMFLGLVLIANIESWFVYSKIKPQYWSMSRPLKLETFEILRIRCLRS